MRIIALQIARAAPAANGLDGSLGIGHICAMAAGIEGVGEAVTGGMLAAAAEPEAGQPESPPETACRNCGALLAGEYCHRCGQKGHVHRTLKGFWHDLVHGVFHFEGKIWRTLPLLAWRPGELTRRYVQGERARFVSPIALFLFSVFLMFAVFTIIGGPLDFSGAPQSSPAQRAEAEREFAEGQAESRAELAELRAERRRLAVSRRPTAEIDIEIRQAEQRMAVEQQLFRQAMSLIPAGEARREEPSSTEPGREGRSKQAEGPSEPVARDDGPRIRSNWPWLDAALEKARENPALLLYKLQTNAYKFSWALIPISVPFLWLLFLHRRRYRQYKAYDHTVFVTYSIAFMSLGLILLSLLRPILWEAVVGLAIAFVPPLHMYRQLRGAYLLSRWSAIWRTFALILFSFVAGALFFALLVALGAFG
jgi:hypothetical protein